MPGALRLANAWQRGFPLVPRPFAAIAGRSGRSEAEVLDAFKRLRASGVIDRVGPVFRPNAVGASCLAALAVPGSRIEQVAALVSRHEGVNHNYEREHRVNLWFVVTGAHDAAVQATLARIEAESGLRALRLPLLEEFHIDLGFDLETHAAPRARRAESASSLSEREKELVRALAPGLALVERPYAIAAFPEHAVIETLGAWLDAGIVRRLGAVLRHRRLGYEANAMVVWDVPDEELRELGRRLGSDAAVTLCYRRARALPDWRYNLYCMVHGRSRARSLYEVKRISTLHGLGRYPRSILFSRRCFSQRAARYG